MASTGPIIIVEDDHDDQDIMRDMLQEIGVSNKLILFDNTHDAYQYLKNSNDSIFLIFCDVNLPRQNGIEFKRHIDEDPQLRSRSIPFVFLTTSADKQAIDAAYKEMTVQGFFEKSSSFEEQKKLLKLIMDYWTVCKHPNT